MCPGLPPIPVSSTTGIGRSRICPALSEKPLESTAAYQKKEPGRLRISHRRPDKDFFDQISVTFCVFSRQRGRIANPTVNQVGADAPGGRRPARRRRPARQACDATILRRTAQFVRAQLAILVGVEVEGVVNELIGTRRAGRATAVGSSAWRPTGRRTGALRRAADRRPDRRANLAPRAPRRFPAQEAGPRIHPRSICHLLVEGQQFFRRVLISSAESVWSRSTSKALITGGGGGRNHRRVHHRVRPVDHRDRRAPLPVAVQARPHADHYKDAQRPCNALQ